MPVTNLFETKSLQFAGFLSYRDICVPSGVSNFLTGESGSGKSSLLRLFNATHSPTAGEIFYLGRDISEIPALELRRKVLLVSQDVYLFPATIWQNVTRFCAYRGVSVPSQETFTRFAQMCRLELPFDYDCLQMSGGEKQRLFLAIHLFFCPETILLDEPTSSLDNETAFALLENVTAFCREQGINMLAVSHSPDIVEKFAENVTHLGEKI